MNFLYLFCTVPIVITLLAGSTLIPICEEQKTEELQQGCFEDAKNLPIFGFIVSLIMVFVVWMSDSDNRKKLKEDRKQKKIDKY